MITLTSLGTLDLRGDDDRPLQPVLAQPKRLALLVYLALATPRGYHRRDSLLALLWPEFDETRARAALSRATHYLRASVGEDVLLSRGQADLGLDLTTLQSDVAAFEAALERGELAQALALYKGPLLPGFFVSEAPDFERWLDGERARLQQAAILAARQVSEQEESAGRLPPAVEWARRAIALAPHDEPALRRLMLLLERTSDRTGALKVHEDFVIELERDLSLEPAAETRALYEAIRQRRPVLSAASPPPTQPLAVSAPPAQAPSAAPRRANTRALALGAGVAALAVVGLWGARIGASLEAAPKVAIAITPLAVQGGGLSAAAVDSVRRALTQQLDTAALVHVVTRNPRYVIGGRIDVHGVDVVITASIADTAPGAAPFAFARVDGAPSQAVPLAHELARQILTIVPAHGSTHGASLDDPTIASRDTRSDVALEAARVGGTAYLDGRFHDAVREYRRAVAADPDFGLAYLHLSEAAQWDDDWALAEWASTMAMKHASTFTPLDQLRTRAWDAYVRADPRDAERLFRIVLANAPGDDDASYTLGEVLFHWGPQLGSPIADAQRAFGAVGASHETNLGALLHLARAAAMQGDSAGVDSTVAHALRLHADSMERIELRALRTFAGTHQSPAEQSRGLAEIDALDDRGALAMATSVAVAGVGTDGAERVVDLLLEPRRGAGTRDDGAILRAELDVARGRRNALFSAPSPLPTSRVAEFRAAFATAPFLSLPRDTLLAIRAGLARSGGDSTFGPALYDPSLNVLATRREYLLGLLSARLGDDTGAAAYVDTLTRGATNPANLAFQRSMANVIRATQLRASGKFAEALALLGEPAATPDHVLPGILSYPVADERFLRAELYHDLGRDDEAARWYETFPDPGGYDLMFLAPALRRRAEIAAARGDTSTASALRARAEKLQPATDHVTPPASHAPR
jgi:serine/threonine-protein kinase